MNIKATENLIISLLNKEWNINKINYNLNNLGWTFAGFDKSIKRLGICYSNKKQIGLSKKMCELRIEKEIDQTIRHEIGHAIDTEIRGYSSHDFKWKNIAQQCGYNGGIRINITNEVRISSYTWFAYCEIHGILGGWSRKPKDNKLCRKCRKKILILPSTDKRIIEKLNKN
jgi:predicted SprT family Zn-dependent metalloprotease